MPAPVLRPLAVAAAAVVAFAASAGSAAAASAGGVPPVADRRADAGAPDARSTPASSPASSSASSSGWSRKSLPWSWPVPAPRLVLRAFDPPPEPWLAGHRGVDLGAPAGTPVVAAGTGRIAFSGLVAGRGVVVVSHGDLRTTYEPVDATVRRGDEVRGGDQLGLLDAAASHCGSRTCLHWGLRRGAAYLDPLALLRPPRVRLLPHTSSVGPGRTAGRGAAEESRPRAGFGPPGGAPGAPSLDPAPWLQPVSHRASDEHDWGVTPAAVAALALALGLLRAGAAGARRAGRSRSVRCRPPPTAARSPARDSR